MFAWLKSAFATPQPAGPPEIVKRIAPEETTIDQESILPLDGGWQIEISGKGTVSLFELPVEPGTDNCMLTFRARMASQNLTGRAYLEMWCRLPGRGSFFSKGLNTPVKGSMNWADYEVPFFLKKGQQPDLLRLGVFAEGQGTVQISDISVWKTPLK